MVNTSIRSLNDVKKCCMESKIAYEPDAFNPKTTQYYVDILNEPSTSNSDDLHLNEIFQHHFLILKLLNLLRMHKEANKEGNGKLELGKNFE